MLEQLGEAGSATENEKRRLPAAIGFSQTFLFTGTLPT